MRVDGLADVGGVGPHLDGERYLRDQIARVRPDDARADHPLVLLVEDELGEVHLIKTPLVSKLRKLFGMY